MSDVTATSSEGFPVPVRIPRAIHDAIAAVSAGPDVDALWTALQQADAIDSAGPTLSPDSRHLLQWAGSPARRAIAATFNWDRRASLLETNDIDDGPVLLAGWYPTDDHVVEVTIHQPSDEDEPVIDALVWPVSDPGLIAARIYTTVMREGLDDHSGDQLVHSVRFDRRDNGASPTDTLTPLLTRRTRSDGWELQSFRASGWEASLEIELWVRLFTGWDDDQESTDRPERPTIDDYAEMSADLERLTEMLSRVR